MRSSNLLARQVAVLLLRPCYSVLMIFGLKLSSRTSATIGKCRFYGPVDFVEECKQAVARLRTLDEDARLSLTNTVTFVFWFNKGIVLDDRFNRIHSITGAYLDWGREGIVTRLIYAVNMQKVISADIIKSSDELYIKHNAVRIRTQEWLKSHNFPAALIEPFDTPASP